MIGRIKYNSPVVLTFFFLTLAVLLLSMLTKGASTDLLFCIYRIFTHILGHANFAHWAGNMTLFLLLGPILEEKYGSENLLIMMAVVAVLTGIINLILFPDSALMGASGIVFMMMLLSSVVSVSKGEIPLTLIVVAVVYLGQEIYNGLFTADNISHISHLLGGACGGVFGFIMANYRRKA